MHYVLITFDFKSIFTADTDAEARDIASQIAIEKNIYSYIVYNRKGDLIDSKKIES